MHSLLRYVYVNLFLISVLIFSTVTVSAFSMESYTITGRVTDISGEPLVGVSILIKGKSAGTTSVWKAVSR